MTASDRAAHRAELRQANRQRKADELRAEGDEHGADELLAGRCACACGRELDSSVRKVYADVRCRQRHHRRRLQAAAEAAGVPARLSLQALQTSNRTGERHGDAPARRPARKRGPRPGVTVYLPSLELAELVLGHLRADAHAARGLVERRPRDEDGDLDRAVELVREALERRRARA